MTVGELIEALRGVRVMTGDNEEVRSIEVRPDGGITVAGKYLVYAFSPHGGCRIERLALLDGVDA